MRFRIRCRNPQTGQSHEFEIDAHDHDAAQKEILAAGLIVARIEAADGDPTGPPARIPPRALAAERESRLQRRRVGIAGRIIGVCSIVALVLALVGSILSGSSKALGYQDIRASVRFDGERFRIVNMDDFPWRDVLIDINGGLANRGYTLRWDVLASEQAVVVAASAFVDDKGNHYNPAEEPLRQLRIICAIGDGKQALHTRRWGGERGERRKEKGDRK